MKVTREEYEPLSLGVSAVGGDHRIRSRRTPRTSAATCEAMGVGALADVGCAGQQGDAAVEVELEVDRGVGFARPVLLGVEVPGHEMRQRDAEAAPLGSLPLRSSQPEAALTFSRHSGTP